MWSGMRTVGSGRVDVLVAVLKSDLDGLLDGAWLRLPGTEAERRHLSAGVELGDSGGGHGE